MGCGPRQPSSPARPPPGHLSSPQFQPLHHSQRRLQPRNHFAPRARYLCVPCPRKGGVAEHGPACKRLVVLASAVSIKTSPSPLSPRDLSGIHCLFSCSPFGPNFHCHFPSVLWTPRLPVLPQIYPHHSASVPWRPGHGLNRLVLLSTPWPGYFFPRRHHQPLLSKDTTTTQNT